MTPMSDIYQFNCENEPIHIPGRIQDNGFLLGMDTEARTILYVSENIKRFSGIDPVSVLSRPLSDFLQQFTDEQTGKKIKAFLAAADFKNLLGKNSIQVKDVGGNEFTLVAHIYNNMLIVEFEIAQQHELQDGFDFSDAYTNIVSYNSIKERCEYLCEQVRKFSGYDRVMIYQFDEDYNGEVIAENNAPGIHSFLHHRFPATDIPAQARDLYVRNLMRIIADVNDQGSAILAAPSTKGTPLDMSFSILRAVSPVHVAYLKNMGVQASFSTSIVVQGKLWGLVTCHHFEPSLISYNNRFNCRTLTQLLGNSIFMLQSLETNVQKEKYTKAFGDVVKKLALNSDLRQVLQYKLNESTGAAYINGNEVETVGRTPSRADILAIADHIFENTGDKVFASSKLGSKMALSPEAIETASGVLAIPMLKDIKEMLVWFKPEMPTQVKWAGNPEKIMSEYQGKPWLNPRTSFLSWSQNVSGISAEWNMGEIETARSLQAELEHIIHLKAQEIKLLHEKLRMAYDELSTFSYTVSHDLKMPLTGIKNYSELIALTEEGLSADGRSYLDTVIHSTDKMNTLINEVFNYTRAGLLDLNRAEVDIPSVINRVVEENKAAFGDKVNIQTGDLINVKGDAMMLYQLFGNIISNAVKYSSKTNDARVTINSYADENKVIYEIEDNGIGIPPEDVNRLFLPFERMSNSKEFEGTGLGMAIVKRIADKHRAEIEIKSELNQGTRCTIIFTDKI